ncbi:MAG TPA: DUF2249 domain-containing protein [Chloroflexia bacterium]|nr:DUF2249 domain-containing protein [Chloroflexia bacterium]
MSKVSETIHNHHEEILATLGRHVAAITEGQGQADPRGLVEFLQHDLIPHAEGEELALYPAVDPLVKQYRKATATMTIDHEYIVSYIDEIAATVARIEAQGSTAALEADLKKYAYKLEALLQVHLDKEERVYVPLFERYLSEDEQQRILDRMHEAYEEAPDSEAEGEVQTVDIDVRTIPPRDRHPFIFSTFDGLMPGGAIMLVNDHDPKPLFYQFSAERAGEFTWDYVESGPMVWRVRIGKAARVPAGTPS